MPDMPYDMLAGMPAVGEEPEEPALSVEEPAEDEAEGLSPELRQLGQQIGLNPKQTAALREFVAAAMLGDDEADEALGAEL
jgi:hypothetical protein